MIELLNKMGGQDEYPARLAGNLRIFCD